MSDNLMQKAHAAPRCKATSKRSGQPCRPGDKQPAARFRIVNCGRSTKSRSPLNRNHPRLCASAWRAKPCGSAWHGRNIGTDIQPEEAQAFALTAAGGALRRSFWLEKSVRTAIAVPMANDPPFATLNHVAGDLGIPSESALLRIGIRGARAAMTAAEKAPEVTHCVRVFS
jgi:hypothetical protein